LREIRRLSTHDMGIEQADSVGRSATKHNHDVPTVHESIWSANGPLGMNLKMVEEVKDVGIASLMMSLLSHHLVCPS